MLARNVTFQTKPNQRAEFTLKFQNEILPLLLKTPGFRDQLTLHRNSNETVGITLWDNQAQLEAYVTSVDAQVIKLLEPLTNGIPDVRTYEVSSSTAYKLPVA